MSSQIDPSNNPLGIEHVPNLRWTFSVCPNTAAGTNGAAAAAGGGAASDTGKKASGFLAKITGEDSASAEASNVPPPLHPETVVPLAALYTPMFDHAIQPQQNEDGTFTAVDEAATMGYLPRVMGNIGRNPPQCKSCRTFLNKQIGLDPSTRVWSCPCCFSRNTLSDADAAVLLAPQQQQQLHPIFQYPTVEYVLAGEQPMTPVFLFVVDCCIDRDELEAMKLQLSRAVEWLPPDARVGFMTFGHNVTLWELGCDDISRCYSFRGSRRYNKAELQAMLGLPKISDTNSHKFSSQQQQQTPQQKGGPSTPAPSSSASSSSTASFPGTVQDRFLCRLQDCELALGSIIERSVKVDPFAVPVGHRPLRATGAALEIAVALLELVADSHFGKVLLFCGGPCTRGPGCVVESKRSVLMRGHKDLQAGNAPLYSGAVAFYNELELRLTRTTSSLDTFIFSLDQVGLMELRSCINNTGGLIVMGDKFQNKMFAESLHRYFERSSFNREESSVQLLREQQQQQQAVSQDYTTEVVWTRGRCSGFGLDIRVNTSPETKIMGALGHCRAADYAALSGNANAPPSGSNGSGVGNSSVSNNNNNCGPLNNASPHRIGAHSQSSRWLTSSADTSLSICFVFDTDCPVASVGRKRFVQIVTKYYATNGEYRARVTSVAMPMPPPNENSVAYIQRFGAFDQECAAVVVARMAVSLMERSNNSRFESVRRWIDKMLVLYCRKFGTHSGTPESLRIPVGFSLFPAFLFHFRRSEYFMILNISPDETTFKRHFLMRETCDNCTIMIQPVLYSYDIEHPMAQVAALDISSIRADNILLIDAFFGVWIMYGTSIEAWYNEGYQDQPENQHFTELLAAPSRDAESILAHRMPYPWFNITGRWGGDARHFLNRFSAGGTAASAAAGSAGAGKAISGDGGTLFTEDASMSKFMASLKAAVVQPDTK